MAKEMTNEEIYDFIGNLAIALYSKNIQISLGALRAILLDKCGKDYVNNRGMASAVAAAYRRWEKKDPIIYLAIAFAYTDKEGQLAYDEAKKIEEVKKAYITKNESKSVKDAEAEPKTSKKK